MTHVIGFVAPKHTDAGYREFSDFQRETLLLRLNRAPCIERGLGVGRRAGVAFDSGHQCGNPHASARA